MAGISFDEFVNGGSTKKGGSSSRGISVSEFVNTDFNKKKKSAIDFSQYDPDILNTLKQDSSTWNYDLFDAEDMQRKAQGLMPKSLADDYDLDDPVDKALYEGGYVSRKNFSKGYQQAERDNASKANFNTEVIKGVQKKLTSDPEKNEKEAFDEVFEELRKSDAYKNVVKSDDKGAFFKQYAKDSMQSKLADAPNEFEVSFSDWLNRKDGALGSVGMPQPGETYTERRLKDTTPAVNTRITPITEEQIAEAAQKKETAQKEEKADILTDAAKYQGDDRIKDIDSRIKEINRTLNRTQGVQQTYIAPDKVNALLGERNALQAELSALQSDRAEITAGRNASALAPFYKTTKAADFAQNSEYDPSRARTEDILYSFINGETPVETSMLNPMGVNAPSSTSDPNYAFAYMTDEERSIYNYLVNTGGDDKAFLEAVRPYVNKRMREAVEFEAQAYAEDRPVLSSLQSIVTSPVSAIEGLIGLGKTGINTIKGQDTDPNDPAFQNTRKSNTIRNTVANTIKAENQGFVGEALAMLYQTGMSMGDTAIRLPMGAAGLGVAGLSASASAMDDALSRGATSGQALTSGLMTGAAEVVFEKASLDNLLSMSRAGNIQDVVKNILKQGGVEASEEVFTEIANTISDAVIMADKSKYETAVRENITAIRNSENIGFELNGVSPEEAEKLRRTDYEVEMEARQKASMEIFKEIINAGIGGFISGGGFGTGGQMMALGRTALTGRAIDNAGMTDATIMEGLIYPETSEAYKMAAATDFENINYLDVGKQFYANAEAANQQARMAFEQEVATATGSQEHTAAAMKLFDRMAQGVADQKLVKAFSKIQETIRATTAKKAEIDAELETENMRIEAKLSGAYNKMVAAMEAGDVNAFNAAKHAYLSQYKIEQAEARLAKLKAENKTAAETAKTQAAVEEASLTFETLERIPAWQERQEQKRAQIYPRMMEAMEAGDDEAFRNPVEKYGSTGAAREVGDRALAQNATTIYDRMMQAAEAGDTETLHKTQKLYDLAETARKQGKAEGDIATREELNNPQPKPHQEKAKESETPKMTTRKTASAKDVEASKTVFKKLEPSARQLLTSLFGSDAETVAAEMYARYRLEVEGKVAEDIPNHVKEKFFEAFEEVDSGHTETAEGEVIYQTEAEEDEQVGDQKGYGLKHEYDKRTLSEADRKVLKNSKNELRLLDTIAKMGKVDIALVPTIKGINVGGRTMQSAPNGVYDRQNSKIYVALDAQGGAISYIAFHELTHYIKQHAKKSYGVLEKTVFDALGDAKVRQLVSEQMQRHGYSTDVAREEVLANSIPAILTDKQYVEKFVRLDPHAASRIKQIIDAILDALTRQFVDLSAINPDFAPMKDLKESVEILRKMQAAFDASLAEASWSRDVDTELVSEMGGGVTFTPVGEVAQIQNKDGTANLPSELEEDFVRVSARTTRDAEYMSAVESNDMEAAERIIKEAAAEAGYTDDLYHGTDKFGFTKVDMRKSDDRRSFFTTTSPELAKGYTSVPMEGMVTRIGVRNESLLTENSPADAIATAIKTFAGYAKDVELLTKSALQKEIKESIANLKNRAEAVLRKSGDRLKRNDRIDLRHAIECCEQARNLEELQKLLYFNDVYALATEWEEERYEDVLTAEEIDEKYKADEALQKVRRIREDAIAKITPYSGHVEWVDKKGLWKQYLDDPIGFRKHRGAYKLYGSPRNQFVMDAHGAAWNSIEIPENMKTGSLEGTETAKTRWIAKWAEEQGYSSVRINNVYDAGPFSELEDRVRKNTGDIVIYLKGSEELVKSADPITYDDDGNVIPPSKRFQPVNELRFSDRAEEPASNQISQAAKIRAEAERLFAAGVTPQKYFEMHPDGKGFSVRVSRLLIGMWLKAGKNVGGKISDDSMNAIMQNRDFFDFKGIFGTGVGKNVKLNLMSPLRVFEQIGNWRPGKDAESRTLNYLEGEALKETFFNPVMSAGAYANLFMEKESEKIKAKLEAIPKADRRMMACLTQLAGENLATEMEVNSARFGKNGMLVRTKAATYVFNKDGQITAISSKDEETNETTLAIFDDNYYRRIRESQKDIEAIMGKRNAAMSTEEKNKRVSEIKQRARQNKPVVLQGKDLVIYEGGSNLKVESPMGKVLLELNDAKSPTAGPVMDLAAALRDFYERVYKMQSKVLVEAGYAPVPYRPDYFPHQGRESTGIMDSILTILMGEPDKIPTEIIGKTGQFKPGKPFVNHLLARLGESTEYDAIRGFNRYLRSAADLMYYTPAIQRLRQLENFLRQESVGSQNSEIVAWLQEYTNSIANKKHSLDRGGEAFIGREAYTFTDKLTGLFGAAAVAGNLSTALSNNISLLTAIPNIEKKYIAKAAKDSWKSAWTEVIRGGTGDRFLEKIPFLARRLGGYEALLTNEAKMAGRKVNNFLGAMFAFTDRFAVETAARAKYAELMAKGDPEAVRKTNEFLLKNFADRSKGMMPTIYNMRMLRLITQFQLEGQNQLSHFGDINRASVGKQIEKQLTQEQIREIMSRGYADIDWSKIHINTRDPKKFASKMLYLLLLSLWGAFTRLAMGRDQTWNPAGMAIDFATAIKDDDMKGAFSKLGQDMIDQIPFVQTFTGGGRIPAFGGVQNVIDAVPAIFDKDSTGDLAKITQGAAAFVPGGAQASKTIRGIDAYERGGSYSGKGNLRYPVEQNAGNLVRSVLFGPASNQPRGYDYLTDTLTEKKTGAYKELIEAGVKPTEAYDALRAYGGDTNAAKLTSLAEVDVDEKTRKLIANAMGLKLGEGSIKSQAKAEAKEYLAGKEKQYKSGKITKADLEAADKKTQDLIKRLMGIK